MMSFALLFINSAGCTTNRMTNSVPTEMMSFALLFMNSAGCTTLSQPKQCFMPNLTKSRLPRCAGEQAVPAARVRRVLAAPGQRGGVGVRRGVAGGGAGVGLPAAARHAGRLARAGPRLLRRRAAAAVEAVARRGGLLHPGGQVRTRPARHHTACGSDGQHTTCRSDVLTLCWRRPQVAWPAAT